MTEVGVRRDEELVARLVDGDQQALGAVYDRYADRIHDFCLRMLHDPADAADATHDTFLTAAHRIGTLRDAAKLRAWLYAVARTRCLAVLRARKRTMPSDELEPHTRDRAQAEAQGNDVAALVASASAGLDERDRAALQLHLRHDLDGGALADALGVSPAHARKITQRVRERLERSMTALLVARRGSDDCPDLAALLRGWDGTLTPTLRKRVARHVDRCDVCDASRRRLVSPAALLGAMPLVPAPRGLRERLIASWRDGHAPAGPAPPDGTRWAADGFPRATSPRRWAPLVAAIVVVALAFGAGVGIGRVTGDDEAVVASATSTTTTTATTVPSTTASPSTVVTTTTLGVRVVSPSPTTAPADRTPPSLSATAEPAEIWAEPNGQTACPGRARTSTVTADATDDTGISAVRFRWPTDEEPEERLVRAAPHAVEVGPFPQSVSLTQQRPYEVEVTVEAFDRAGNLATTTTTVLVRPAGDCIG